MLEVRNLAKAWPDFELGASLSIQDGEIAAILGPSGCGKSTLLRLIAGLDRPDSGSVILDGKELGSLGPEKRGIGLVFQDFALFPGMSVRRNIEYGPRMAGMGKAERDRLADSLAASMEIARLLDRNPASLSGGEQQRVALARALAARPRLVLLDEPLSSLDAGLRRRLRVEIAERLRSASVMAIHVTHDVEEAFAMADRVFVMGRGRIAEEGSPEELYTRPRTAYGARFLGRGPVLAVRSMQSAGKMVRAHCAIGSFLCAHGENGTLSETGGTDSRVALFFPADSADFVDPSSGGENIARARVLGTSFGGRFRRLRLAFDAFEAEASGAGEGILEIELETPIGFRPQPGERVAFRVAPEDCILLPEAN